MSEENQAGTNITELLRKWGEGDAAVTDELISSVYNELRLQAARYLRRERSDHTLQTTALVHEAYLKLAGQREVVWKNRGHFFAIAAQAMRRILLDHAKGRHRQKRGGEAEDISLDETLVAVGDEKAVDVEELDQALSRLSHLDPRAGRIVELRYFAGLSVEETAEALEVSKATVAREWQMARAWLFREMSK